MDPGPSIVKYSPSHNGKQGSLVVKEKQEDYACKSIRTHKGVSNCDNNHSCSFFNSKRNQMGMLFTFFGICLVLGVTLGPCILSLNIHDETPHNKSDTIYLSGDTGALRVGAFNIRQFGKSLMRRDNVTSYLVAIFQRYDIILVQEVRDSSHNSLKELRNLLNSTTGQAWDFVVSDPLGRSKYYREQYVFFYKVFSVKHTGSHQVNDSLHDVYEREPYAAEFEFVAPYSSTLNYNHVSNSKPKQRFVLLGLHTKPTSAEQELRQFPTTIKSVASIFPDALGVIALGDLNADCNFLSKKARAQLDIFTNPDFQSLIPHTVDSTVSRKTYCAYDRIIVYNSEGKLDARNGEVFNFQTYLNLDEEQASQISDHYPVEFLLY